MPQVQAFSVGDDEDVGGGIGSFVSAADLKKSRCLGFNEIAALALLFYLIIGLIQYVFVEGKDPLDSVYMSIATLLTIGYGDVEVVNRGFQSFYIVLGSGFCLAFFASLSANFLEKEEAWAKRRLAVLTSYLAGALLPQPCADPEQPNSDAHDVDAHGAAALAAGRTLSLETMDAEIRQLQHAALVHCLHLTLVMLVGAAIVGRIEHWSYSDAIYFAISTICSVGYGDILVKSSAGKVFTIIYAPLGCAVCMKGFADLVRWPMVLRAKQAEMKVLEQFAHGLSERALRAILANATLRSVPRLQASPTALSKAEFLLSVMLMMGRVSESDVHLTATVFDSLDVQGTGSLSLGRLREELLRARQREDEANADRGGAAASGLMGSLLTAVDGGVRGVGRGMGGMLGLLGDKGQDRPETASAGSDVYNPLRV